MLEVRQEVVVSAENEAASNAESCAQENFFGQNTNCTGHVACEHGQVGVVRGQWG